MTTPSSPPFRILVVEDEPIVALDLTATLTDLGYTVAGQASSGEEAVRSALELAPDMVLMDIDLDARYAGIVAAREIRQRLNIPILFATAYDDEATLHQAQVVEPYAYLLKPFSDRALRVAIETARFHHVMQRERQRLLNDLETASRRNALLEGLLAMCASCRRVRDTDASWVSLETYVEHHLGAQLSHGLCPECERRYLDELGQQRH
jgi:CheY-like chemotaxis protein